MFLSLELLRAWEGMVPLFTTAIQGLGGMGTFVQCCSIMPRRAAFSRQTAEASGIGHAKPPGGWF